MRKIISRLSYANVMATLALFVALGGTGYAAIHLPKGSVGRAQLRRHAVGNLQLGLRSVTASRVKPNALGGNQINEATLGKVPASTSSDHATSASTADDAARVGGVTASQLRLSCPIGTTLYAGACMETAERATADWPHAERSCANAGRQLPSAFLVDSYISDHDLTTTEWTGDLAAGGTAISAFGQAGFNEESLTTQRPFRCVAAATN